VKDFVADFPLLEECTYLNTAYTGLIPRSTYQWRKDHEHAFFTKGSLFREGHRALFEELRVTVSRLYNSDPAHVAFVPNFSIGYNILLDGLPTASRVLGLKDDYPVVNWAVQQRGFDHYLVEVHEQFEEDIYQAVKKFGPDVFVFSLVQYTDGLRLSETFLGQLKKDFPNLLLLADGTQFMGTEYYDFSSSAIDVIGCSGYKWMLSGFGNGVFLFKPGVEEVINPPTIGYNSADSVDGDYKAVPFFGKFEPGHLDTFNFGSMLNSLRYLSAIGLDKIGADNRRISRYAMQRLLERGLLDRSLLEREVHSTIYNVQIEEETAKLLKEKGVICAQRGGGTRISTHFYNGTQDIDRFLELL